MINFNIDHFIQDFDYKNIHSWEKLLNDIPRFPFINIADCILCCYLIRSQLKFSSSLVSLVFTLFLCTITDNTECYLNRRKLAIFQNTYLAPFIVAVWILYNFVPFDLVYKITRILSPFLSIIAGFIAGRDISRGIDMAVNIHPKDFVSILITGIVFASVKYLSIFLCGQITHQTTYRSIGPIIFGVFIGANAYYWLTDLGHISYTFWYDKEFMKLCVSVFMSVLGFLHFIIPDKIFISIWHDIEYIFGLFIPYYGRTWNIPKAKRIFVKNTKV